MEKEIKVSLITVTYNSGKTLAGTIESVIKQNYHNIEYIIVDGNSNDDTLDIIKEYEQQFPVKWISEPDEGLYDAMNKGIKMATGDIVGIINSDDFYSDERVISEIVKEFKEGEQMDMVYGDLKYVKEEDTNIVVRTWISKPYSEGFFERGHVPPHPTLFLRKEVYNEVGLFSLEYAFAADYEFMLRIFKLYDFRSKYINRIIVKMRLGGKTNKSIKNIIRGNVEILNSWKKNNLKPPLFFLPRKFLIRLKQYL